MPWCSRQEKSDHMSFKYLHRMPSPEEVIDMLSIDQDSRRIKEQRDNLISQVLMGKSEQFILIIGPCSAHHDDAVYDYVNRLGKLQEKVKEKLVLIPRIYTNKPRTTGEGYKGMAHQPDPLQNPDMVKGVKMLRHMHLKAIQESGLTAADEMLYPENYAYLADLLSYVAVGARSVENQQHRLTASGISVPVGMKNPTSGDFSVMLNAIKAAQLEHIFIYNGWEVSTDGNPLTHAVLRGRTNRHGENVPNYHYEDLMFLAEHYQNLALLNPTVIIDTNHANSGKCFAQQPRIAKQIMYSRRQSSLLKNMVKGLMIESFIVEGNQPENGGRYGQSITDPCLGWEDTERLIYELADLV